MSTAASWLSALAGIARFVLVVDLAVAAGVGLLGWILGWSTRAQWGEGFVWSGIAALAAGGLAVSGAWGSRLAYVGFAASTSDASLDERTRLMGRESMGAYRRMLFLAIVGLPLLALGIWLDPRV